MGIRRIMLLLGATLVLEGFIGLRAQTGVAQMGNAQIEKVQTGSVQTRNVQIGKMYTEKVKAGSVETENTQTGSTQTAIARISEENRTMVTYPFSDPNPVPALAINKKLAPFYPYFAFDGYTDKGVPQQWKVVKLENPFITVTVLPEVGGKVMGATERSTGNEFVYENHVMKFRAIGIRGPWTSGGIEHNFGLDLGHAPWAASPVDYVLQTNPDGSVSCIVGGLDLASRSEWRVNIRLPRDKAYFETESMWFNPSPLHHAYLSWENAAFKATNDLSFYFPGTMHIGHDGLASPWPIDSKGRDLSLYKNNNFGGSKSYHVAGDYRNWYGGIWNDKHFGFGHWTPYADAAGKKLWIWSLAREGAIWEDLLTDHDGQYVEAQSGVKFNQTNERSGFHSPFTQHSFRPSYTETKKEYWFPVVKAAGMSDASPYGTLYVTTGDTVTIRISPNIKIDDSLIITSGGRRVYSELLHALPTEMLERKVVLPAGSREGLRVSVGADRLLYTNNHEQAIHRPFVAVADDQQFTSAQRSFRLGEEENSMRNYTLALTYYQECLRQEPTHTEALCRVAEYYYRNGSYEKGLAFAQRALSYNAYDGSANYIYGNLLLQLGRLVEAKEAFSTAVLSMEYRSAAYCQLAGVLLREHDFEGAAVEATKALQFNDGNMLAREFLCVAYRRSGDLHRADSATRALLTFDPLNHFAGFELYLLQPGVKTLSAFGSTITNELPHETYLELAMTYLNAGCPGEAVQVLEAAPSYPTVYYWLAWLKRDPKWLEKAEAMSARMVFPFRPEEIAVLEWARTQHDSWKTSYYLGLCYWNNLQPAKAIECMKACGDAPDLAAFYLARGTLYSKDSAMAGSAEKDFARAIVLEPSEWRGWHYSNASVADRGKAYARFPKNAVIAMDYAKALLNAGRYTECASVLSKTLVLPQEGAQDGHDLYEQAYLWLAIGSMEQGQYKKALGYLDKSRLWPENLGAGSPYDPDVRLQDWLAAWCERKLKHEDKATALNNKIRDYSMNASNWAETPHAANNYISIQVLRQLGLSEPADRLAGQWRHVTDSLRDWQITAGSSAPEVKWVLAKAAGDDVEAVTKMFARVLSLVDRKEIALLPVPQQVVLTGRQFSLDRNWVVKLEGVDTHDPAVEDAREMFSGHGGIGERGERVVRFRVRAGAVAGHGGDAYRLKLGENEIVVAANAPQGLYYGVQTLRQLLRSSSSRRGSLPEGEITDWSSLPVRMIYWDDAHHLEKMDAFKRIIRQASQYKINAVSIKLEGHFQFRCAPAIVEPNALSAAQLQELTDYAAKYYVEIVPYLDAPAHVSFILKHPEYAHLRLFPDNNYEFNVMHPGTDSLLTAMFTELIDATKGGRHVLMSTDEAYYVGKGGDEIAEAKRLGGNGRLWAQFAGRLAEKLHRQGRDVIFWGEFPMTADDITTLPSHMIDGVYDPAIAAKFRAHGIRQYLYTPTQGAEPVFPNYAPGDVKVAAMLKDIHGGVGEGTIVAGWGDAGLHPETFWLGYITGSAAAWHRDAAIGADRLSRNFYELFYGRSDMARAYELLSTQAEFYDRSWIWGPSNLRSPILGSSEQIFDIPEPAKDQTLPALCIPDAETLRPGCDWTALNKDRLAEVRRFAKENDELELLLSRPVIGEEYHMRVLGTVTALCRQNLDMLLTLERIDELMKHATVAAIDSALDLAAGIRLRRDSMMRSLSAVWYEEWEPLVAEAHGRKFLLAVDNIKDHQPGRTIDLSYLIYRDIHYPLDQWIAGTLQVRNSFAAKRGLPVRE